MRTLDFWFDYSCPYAYLGSTQVEALARRTGAALTFCPMLLGGVFKSVGTPQNMMDVLAPSKARHNLNDMHRWAEFFGVPFSMPSGHPFRTVEALRATLVTRCDPAVMHGFYRAYWVEGKRPSEPATLREVLGAAGHDVETVMAHLQDSSVKDDLRRRTEEAIALGIFGAPAFIVNGTQLYWGQDRIDFVARALTGRADAGEAAAL
ncbi:MAG TPA: 2-hydroxychromene-2-carboxylate isomerase [Polyangiaceae bacterium]|nr:2-hydroxychromene-2-carboxylate isomerase [Polyangiaceae bacterium]